MEGEEGKMLGGTKEATWEEGGAWEVREKRSSEHEQRRSGRDRGGEGEGDWGCHGSGLGEKAGGAMGGDGRGGPCPVRHLPRVVLQVERMREEEKLGVGGGGRGAPLR
jgi:hypothetical protein